MALDSDMKHITLKHADESRAHSVAQVAAHLRAALRKEVMEGDVPKVEVDDYHHISQNLLDSVEYERALLVNSLDLAVCL